MSGFILDASVALAWLFHDESDDRAETALDRLANFGATVPVLWHYEIRNALLVAQRRDRISKPDADKRLTSLLELPIQIDESAQFDKAMELAHKYQLSFYDALYLELATRKKLPLATLDKKLNNAAINGEKLPSI